LLGGVGIFALATVPAAAQVYPGFSGVLGGDYSNSQLSNGGGRANGWGADGIGAFNFAGTGLAAQGEVGWQRFDGSNVGNWNDWNFNGAAYWTGFWGRAGGTAGYQTENGDLSGHVTNYDAFGELYAGRMFTLGLKGGGFSGSAGLTGNNIGVEGVVYPFRDLALSGTYDFFHLDHFGNENDWGVQGEWMFSERLPISLWGGYQNSEIQNVGHVNTFMIGLKLYTDGFGPAPLVDRQRNGAEQWGTKFAPAGFTF
jgi:hypothetical protein